MYEKLIYTNSAGKSVEFSTASNYHVNIRKDVSGLSGLDIVIFSSEIVGMDGDIETGLKVQPRYIDIVGKIKTRSHTEQDQLSEELSAALSPFYTGVLRYEGEHTREIDVRVKTVPDPRSKVGDRMPNFNIEMKAEYPYWRLPYEKTATIADTGTSLYYDGTKPCGIQIEITAKKDDIDMDSFTVQQGGETKALSFRTGGGLYLQTDDVISLNTTPGQVNITLNDDTALERFDTANCYFPFELYPGVNVLSWTVKAIEYSASETYALGAIVEYSGAFYECSTAIEAPEAWTAGHWTAISEADMFDVTITYTPLFVGV